MPTPKLTPEASDAIARGKAAKRSSRALQQELREDHGLVVDQRTISRHTKKIGVDKPRKGPRRSRAPAKAAAKAKSRPTKDADFKVLTEIPALEREAARLQKLLHLSITASDRAKLNSELRGTFKQIRLAQAAAVEARARQSADVKALVAKLTREAEKNDVPKRLTLAVAGDAATEDVDDDEPDLPQAAGA